MNDFERIEKIAKLSRCAFDKLNVGKSASHEFYQIGEIAYGIKDRLRMEKRQKFKEKLKKNLLNVMEIISFVGVCMSLVAVVCYLFVPSWLALLWAGIAVIFGLTISTLEEYLNVYY